MEIWIHINDCQEGPFAIDNLPVDRIAPDTPVWHEGLPDWVYAKDVPALTHLFAAPEPAEESAPEPAEEPAEEPADMPENTPSDNSECPDNSEHSDTTNHPRQQPWEPLPPRQPQYPPQQQYYPQQPPYPYRYPAYPGPMHRPMPQRPMPQRPMPQQPFGPSYVPKAPSMWLWLSIPVTILFGGSVFGIVSIILGVISRKKYKAGAYGTAIKLSRACEWLLMIGITLGFAMIPFSMFV